MSEVDLLNGCDICGEGHSTEHCPELNLDDTIVSLDQLSTRARLTLPPYLRVEEKSSGLVGVVAQQTVKKKTQLGPYEAKRTTHIFDDAGFFTLRLLATDGTTVCLDTTDENECNWLCLVRAALSREEQNCMAYQLGSNIFYSTTRDLMRGEELLVWYAPHFARKLGKPPIPDGVTRVLLGHRIEPLMSDMVIEEIEGPEETTVDNSEHTGVTPLVDQETQAGETTEEPSVAESSTEESTAVLKQAQVRKGFYCPRCGSTFSSQSQMVLHLRQHVIQAAKDARPNARGPGRPRKRPILDPNRPKRSRGRPKKYESLMPIELTEDISFNKTSGTYSGLKRRRQQLINDPQCSEVHGESDDNEKQKEKGEDYDEDAEDIEADLDEYFPKKEVEVSIIRTQPRRSTRGRHTKYDNDYFYPTEKKSIIQGGNKSVRKLDNVAEKVKLGEGSSMESSSSGVTNNEIAQESTGKKVVQVKVGIKPVITPWWKKRGRHPKKHKQRVEIVECTGNNLDMDKERLTADMVKESLAALKGQNAVIMVEINELKNHKPHQQASDAYGSLSGDYTGNKANSSQNYMDINKNRDLQECQISSEVDAEVSMHENQGLQDTEHEQESTNEQADQEKVNSNNLIDAQTELNDEMDGENVIIMNTEDLNTGIENTDNNVDTDIEEIKIVQQEVDHLETSPENKNIGESIESIVETGVSEQDNSTDKIVKNESVVEQINEEDIGNNGNEIEEENQMNEDAEDEASSRNMEMVLQIEKLGPEGADKGSLVMMFEETVDGKYGCMLCNTKFTEEINAISHFMEHSQKENEPCITCGKTFKEFNDLMEHRKECVAKKTSNKPDVNSSHEEGNFECDVCHQTFKSAHYLYRHMVMHTDIFCCIKCNKTFSRKDSLQKHVLKCCPEFASDYGIYYCENCHRVFSKKGGLQRHQTKCKSVKCDQCNKVYATVEEVESHKCEKRENEETAKFACGQCSKCFQSMYYLNQHLQMHKNMFICSRCGRNLASQDELDTHSNQCETLENIRMYGSGVCAHCDMRFNNSKQFREHALSHTHPFHCERCDKRFVKVSSWKAHECVDVPNMFTCLTCKRDFRGKSSLEKHKANEECLLYSCRGCSKRFHFKSAAKEHVESCDQVSDKMNGIIRKNEMQEVCKVCSKTFSSKSNLTKHMVLHGAKRYQCPHCEKKFHLDVYLKEHIGCVHYNIFRYQCNTCGRMLKSKTGLVTHIKMFHSLDCETYSCEICNKTFKQKGNLRAHMFSHSNERQFLCEICPKSFKFPDQLSRHRREHKYTFKLSCPHCQKEFVRGYDLKRHLQIDHSNCIFVCDICNARASQRHTLVRHFKRKHPDKVRLLSNKDYVNSMWKDISALDNPHPPTKISELMSGHQAFVLTQDVADALQSLGVGNATAREIQILKEKGLITEGTQDNIIVPQDSFIIQNEGNDPEQIEATTSEQDTNTIVSSDVGSVDMIRHDDGTYSIGQVSGLPNAIEGLENTEGQIVILQIVDPDNQDKTVEILQDLSALPQGLHVLNQGNPVNINIQHGELTHQGELTTEQHPDEVNEQPSEIMQHNQDIETIKQEQMIGQDERVQMIEQGELIQHGTIVNDGLIQHANIIQEHGFQTEPDIQHAEMIHSASEGQVIHQPILLQADSKNIIGNSEVYTIISTEQGSTLSRAGGHNLPETVIGGQEVTTYTENPGNTEDHAGQVINMEEHSGEVISMEEHSREVINMEEHSGETIEQCEVNHEGEIISGGTTIQSTGEFIDHTGEIIQGQIIQGYGHLMDRQMESVLIQDGTVQTQLME